LNLSVFDNNVLDHGIRATIRPRIGVEEQQQRAGIARHLYEEHGESF